MRLKENPTTGYRWQMQQDGAPACRIAADFTEPENAAVLVQPGRGGSHIWRIEGMQAGTCQIALVYMRQWEAAATPGSSFEMQIHVTGG